jgi:hypothetical protein
LPQQRLLLARGIRAALEELRRRFQGEHAPEGLTEQELVDRTVWIEWPPPAQAGRVRRPQLARQFEKAPGVLVRLRAIREQSVTA